MICKKKWHVLLVLLMSNSCFGGIPLSDTFTHLDNYFVLGALDTLFEKLTKQLD